MVLHYCVKGEDILYSKRVCLKHKFHDIMKLLMSSHEKFVPQMIVNKMMRYIKNSKIRVLTRLLTGCNNTDLVESSLGVYFIILFTFQESRSCPISFVIKGSQ